MRRRDFLKQTALAAASSPRRWRAAMMRTSRPGYLSIRRRDGQVLHCCRRARLGPMRRRGSIMFTARNITSRIIRRQGDVGSERHGLPESAVSRTDRRLVRGPEARPTLGATRALAPLIRAEVGDTIAFVFRTMRHARASTRHGDVDRNMRKVLAIRMKAVTLTKKTTPCR